MNSTELNSLTQSTNMPTLTISHTVSELMAFVTIASLVITLLVFIMWIMNWLHRRKVQNAILDIQATLREMNERDKVRHSATTEQPPVATASSTPETAPAPDR